MHNLRVETYNDPSYFYKNIDFKNDSLHIVGTSALSMHLKDLKQFKKNKNHIWTYANIQNAVFTEWNKSINQIKMKAEIRKLIEELCKDITIKKYLLNDIDEILNDYKYYIETGIFALPSMEKVDPNIEVIRGVFNSFAKSQLINNIYIRESCFDLEEFTNRLNKYYNEVFKGEFKDQGITDGIQNIKKIYFYNLTYIDGMRLSFFKKLNDIGIEVIFRIPIHENFQALNRPWERVYGFVSKDKWKSISYNNEVNLEWNPYIGYLNGVKDLKDYNNDKISFKEYIDVSAFKQKLENYPIFQNTNEYKEYLKNKGVESSIIGLKVKRLSYICDSEDKSYKYIREYITFSKNKYNDLFNGTILNYKDKKDSLLNYKEGRFIIGLYKSYWNEEKTKIMMEYKDFVQLISSGWLEIKSKSNIISGVDGIDLLIDLEPYMNGIKSLEDIINRLNKLTLLQDFSNAFTELSKEKTDGDKVKEYLHNPLKTLSYVDNSRYGITVKQLIQLTKKLKTMLEELIPKDNFINIQEHKNKLYDYWRNISYIKSILNEYFKLKKEYNTEKSEVNKKRLIKFIKSNRIYIRTYSNLKNAELIETPMTLYETREYMNIILKLSNKKDHDDSEEDRYNYIKVFDQIEGIMINGTREIYVTDMSEKSINKYVKNRRFIPKYTKSKILKEDLRELDRTYNLQEKNNILMQSKISSEEVINFIKYYLATITSFSKAKIEFSWINDINDSDQESSIYKILKSIYNENSKRQSVYYDIEGELQFEYERLKEQGVLYKNNSKSIAEINKILGKKTEVSCSSEIAPIAWLDLDFCPRKFYYSGVLCHNPVYESEFHQKIVFAILGKLFKSQLKEGNDVEKYFYPLFPQWNKTTKDNLIETSYKREIRSEYKFKNIYFPYHMKDIQILRSKIYENHRRKRRNAYRNMNILNEKYFNEFIKEDMKYDTVTYIKGYHCDMCPHNMICCKGEFAIERSR
ncbi:hypothetical protein [Hathewaya massiliensis]|uniref:hypothetical protein n=1 Tax=Hathewaya massiliensis TaxID=1964382 RepID=UPI00115A243E|nr:hypothetical protein [Hathewaya massiliensis]